MSMCTIIAGLPKGQQPFRLKTSPREEQGFPETQTMYVLPSQAATYIALPFWDWLWQHKYPGCWFVSSSPLNSRILVSLAWMSPPALWGKQSDLQPVKPRTAQSNLTLLHWLQGRQKELNVASLSSNLPRRGYTVLTSICPTNFGPQ